MPPLPPSQVDIIRGLDAPSRLRLAWELSDAAHALALAGLHQRHPERSAAELRATLARQAMWAAPPGHPAP